MYAVIPLLLCSALLALAGPAPGSKAAAGRDSTNVRITSATGGTGAFVAWPAGQDPAPGVVVIHEWWGLNEQIRTVARRLAKEGYVAIVPDLYHGKVADDPELAHELMRGLDETKAVTDIEAASAWLRAQPRVGKRPIGVVGFCVGGRLAQLTALHGTQPAAVVMFYGRPETGPETLARLRSPLQAHFGAEDRGIGPDQIDALKAGLAKAKKSGEVYDYHGAGHAFMNDTRPSYHADAARLAWARTLQFLQKHLKG